jgi:hypothetical protein
MKKHNLTSEQGAFVKWYRQENGGTVAEALEVMDDYLVLTDDEADEQAKNYILDTVWAFNKSFLDCHSEAISEIDEKTFAKLQEGCESINKAILAMIDDKAYFVEEAISADGRGHFLSFYDGEENEQKFNKIYYFIYRQN